MDYPLGKLQHLWLIRHGPIPSSPGRCIGWTDLALTSVQQAEEDTICYEAMIGNTPQVFSSDLQRTLQTARPIARTLGCPLHATELLREMHFGRWEEKSWEEIQRDSPEEYNLYMEHWRTMPTPGGESYADLASRVKRFYQKYLVGTDHECIAVVGHGGSLRALAAEVLNLDAADSMKIPIDRGKAGLIQIKEKSAKWNIDPKNPSL